jgi:photosystem II stability/assembly factor-like uncharacterized protein
VTWTATTGSWTSKHLNGVWAQGSTAFAVGHGGTILRTVDGGESWTATTMEIPRGVLRPETEGRPALADRQDAALRAIVAADAREPRDLLAVSGAGTVALIVGQRGTILRSTDGGENWALVASGTHRSLAAVWTSGAAAAAVGSDGTIVWSADGGATWAAGQGGTEAHLKAVRGAGAGLVAVGHGGTILRSTDGGGTWGPVAGGTTADLVGIWGAGEVLLVVGWGGTILRSLDGGVTWTRVMGEPWPESASWQERNRLRRATPGWLSVSGSGSTVVAIGSDGSILRSTDQGATWSSAGSTAPR